MTQVIKRNGKRVKFEDNKIQQAIKNAYESSNITYNPVVYSNVVNFIKSQDYIPVEIIQDYIETELMKVGDFDVAKKFIRYRFLHKLQREKILGQVDGDTLVSCKDTIDEYTKGTDWRIKANANTSYSNAGLVNNTAGKVIANYWLDQVYSPEEGLAHRNGDYHIHDLDSLTGYCFTGDTKIRLVDGSTPTLKDLAKTHTNKDIWVFSVNEKGEYVVGRAHSPRITRRNADLVEVKLDNGKSIRCTPDHKFMGLSGDYIEAKNLVEGQSLKSLYITETAVINHEVVSVTKLDYTEDVYDITVDKYHNFALASGVIVHNCAGWSLRNLLNEGFNGVRGRVNSRPPKHFREALGQMANFLGILQSEWAGAQAFSSFDTFLAPYVFRDKLSFDKIKKAIRGFVYNLNVPARWGQSPFTNVTIDWTVPKDLQEVPPMSGNAHIFEYETDSDLIEKAKERGCESLTSMTYKHFSSEMKLIQKAFYEVLTEGDSTGQPFTFPIPTVNITEDFDWEGENVDLLFENAAKIGSSYFQNFIGSQYKKDENGNLIPDEESYKPDAVRSMCCRLQLDLRELLKRGGGLFGSAEMTGSIGVVTINMARLGYLYKGNKELLFKKLGELMDMAKSTLEKKRVVINELFNRGLYPYTKRYLPSFRNHFSTIGINGVNEMLRNFSGDTMNTATPEGVEFSKEILHFMRTRLKRYQEETGNLYNTEATPAEGTTTRFAREDLKRFPDIIQAGTEGHRYYTNSTQLPVSYTQDLFKALKLQDELQTLYTGGTVFHMYMSEMISTPHACKEMVRKVLTNFRMPYITVTPLFSVCNKHGYLKGRHDYCPICDEEIIEKYK